MPKIEMVKVRISSTFLDRKDWVKYLVLVNWHARELGDVIEKVPDARFNRFLEVQVNNYIQGTKPPAAIQSAVMNIADDVLAGREVSVRSGDYIALQNQYRSAKN